MKHLPAIFGASLLGCAVSLLTPHTGRAEEAAAEYKVPADMIAPGPFQPTDDSLKQYQYPDWFRDAKFGIWAHWGPQAVPRHGDWYAKKMYVQAGDRRLQRPPLSSTRYGHPSKMGYKDIIPLWTAEKWDPDKLMALYKKAGAKYFVSMGTHHDDFFLWNSKIHRWNAVNMGPHKDVVGLWQKAAKENGLYFGVSEHLGASQNWFQSAHSADKTGPMAGVPYDGNDPRYEDLYHWKSAPGDTGWLSKDPRWHKLWFSEIKELIDNYHPDLLYSDSGLPFGDVGRSMIAHLYNDNAARNGGKCEAVYNCKENSQGRWVQRPRTRRDGRHQPAAVADGYLHWRLVLPDRAEVQDLRADHPDAGGYCQQERQPADQHGPDARGRPRAGRAEDD